MQGLKNINFSIGLLLVMLIVGVYSYFNNTPISRDDLILISGSLKSPPREGDQGGDVTRMYIKIELNEYQNNFTLINCSYEMADVGDILRLDIDTSIDILIKRSDLVKNSVLIYDLYLPNKQLSLLDLDNFNNCFSKKWKSLIPVFLIVMIIFIFQLLMIVRHRINKKT